MELATKVHPSYEKVRGKQQMMNIEKKTSPAIGGGLCACHRNEEVFVSNTKKL